MRTSNSCRFRGWLPTFTAVAALLFLASCEKTIKVDLPAVPPRLSMISEITAGDSFRIQVGHTVNVKQGYNKANMGVDNAVPLLYEDNLLVDTLKPYSTGSFIYHGKTIAAAGKTYRIDLTAPGYVMATASERVPPSVPVKLERHTPQARRNSSGSDQDEITLSFDDPSTTGDYYVLRIVNFYEESIYSYGGYCLNTGDISVESPYSSDAEDVDINTCLPSNAVFIRDELFNGKHKELKFYVDAGALAPWQDDQGNTVYAKLVLLHVTESYYRFLKSYFGSRSTEGNPFAEPFNITTNVTNGYGIFSVANRSEAEVR